jgi:cold shock CspA family protein
MQGTIVAVRTDRRFGFVRPRGETYDVFFHADDLSKDLEFDDSLRERFVEFDITTTPKGYRARCIRPAK